MVWPHVIGTQLNREGQGEDGRAGSWTALPGAPLPNMLSRRKNSDSAHFQVLRRISTVMLWNQAFNSKKSLT